MTNRKADHSIGDDVSSILNRVIGAIDIIKCAIPIPLGQTILSTTSAILVIIKNKEDFRDLIDQCDWIRGLVQKSNWGVGQDGMTSMLSDALTELNDAIDRTHAQVVQKAQRKLYQRFFSSGVDKDTIQGITKQLDLTLKHFSLRLDMVIAESLRKLEEGLSISSRIKSSPSRSLPPPRPSIFYGREKLLTKVQKIVLTEEGPERRHVALLGLGGIGKSSLAKAVLNQGKVQSKFRDARFFVRFDDILASQITYSTFISRIAQILGLAPSGDDFHLLDRISSRSTLLVLDNAETFLDSRASSDAPRIRRAISDFGNFPTVTLILTSRSRELPHGLRCAKVDVPNLDARAAYQTFRDIYHGDITPRSRSTLERLLFAIGYHPLMTTLLAHAAETNTWSIGELEKHWNAQRTKLLNAGQGKDENLADSIELSLSSSRIRAYCGGAQRVLRIIAFFPQGVRRDMLTSIFPSIPNIHDIVNLLHEQSLTVFNDGFATMLAPIRLYVNDTIALDPLLLSHARAHFYSRLADLIHAKDLILSQDVNVESLVAFDLQTLTSKGDVNKALKACEMFIRFLSHFKPRPTTLRAIVDVVDTADDQVAKMTKMYCFWQLAYLAHAQVNYSDSLELFNITRDLASKTGQNDAALILTLHMANIYRRLGKFSAAKRIIINIQSTPTWTHANSFEQAHAKRVAGFVKQVADMTMTGASLSASFQQAQRLFDSSPGHQVYAALCLADSAFSFALIDNNPRASRKILEHAVSTFQQRERLPYFWARLAVVAFLEGDMKEAQQLLKLTRSHNLQTKRMVQASHDALALAALMTAEGKACEARKLVEQVAGEIKTHGIISDDTRWLTLFVSGLVELGSGDAAKAYLSFTETKKYCESRQEFHFRALSTRSMGELMFAKNDISRAKSHFRETVEICREAGIVPALLYRRLEVIILSRMPPATYDGWSLFLRSRLK